MASSKEGPEGPQVSGLTLPSSYNGRGLVTYVVRDTEGQLRRERDVDQALTPRKEDHDHRLMSHVRHQTAAVSLWMRRR